MWISARTFRRFCDTFDTMGDDLSAARGEVRQLTQRITKMEQELVRLTAEVGRNTSVTAGAAALLGKLAQMIRDAADDPTQVRALADQLTSTTDALAAAVAANTPAEA